MSIVEKARGAGQAIVKVCPPAAYLLIPPMRLADRLQGGTLHRHLEENIELYLTEEQRAAYEQAPIKLAPWDPMGSLACAE